MGLLLEQVVSKRDGCDFDLERGEAIFEGKVSDEQVVRGFDASRQFLSDTRYELGGCDGSMDCEKKVTLSSATNYSDDPTENVKVIVERNVGVQEKNGCVLEKKSVKEKPKAMSAKKHPKPPRPPRGLSLDSADQKIIRELAEMAKLKRARVERMKALKKMKEAKPSSSKHQLFATLFTILFGIVILFQGISSRTNAAATFQGSPVTPQATDGGIISMTHFQNLSAQGSESHSLVEQVSVSATKEKVARAAD